jgi:hypothetical protein
MIYLSISCIGIILRIIEKFLGRPIITAQLTLHETYYTQKALELIVTKFNHDKLSVGKTILTNKLKKLNYTFTITNL